ncbi:MULTISPECIES: hypothetical protein [unclassified Nodularia (in: cyanobacteria)]|uniref:hypothetical protein n=1 Tax=unclassified Nodularia (in: cyanobacteria) TaxID=2656917 RepID=UPI001D141CF6|nr:hypothetical protein [Nodularia sp. LEGE 06071]
MHLGLSKPLFKRNFLIQNGIQYDEKLDIAEDFWLDLKCLIDGARFVLVPEPYYFYRSRSGSLVSSSPRKNLEKSCHKIEKFIREEDAVHSYPNLFRALSKSFTVFKRNLAYYRVVEPLKQKKWLSALIQMVYNPYFFIHVFFQIPGIIDRRIQYYLLGNKSALKLLYHAKKKPGKPKINKSIN